MSAESSQVLATAMADAPSLDWTLLPVSEFASHHETWQRLNASHLDHVLLHPDFVAACLAHFGDAATMLAIGREGSEVQAMMLLMRRGPLRWSSFSPSQLPLAPIVIAPGRSLVDVLDSLIAALPSWTMQLSVEHLDPMLHPRPPDADRRRSMDYIDTCEIVVSADRKTAYFAGLSSNLLSNIRKRKNKAEREHGAPALEVVQLPGALEEAVGRYADLESSGWKSDAGTALRRGDAQSRFYTDVLQRFSGRSEAAVLLLRFGDTVAAARLVIWHGSMVVILKTAFNESLRAFAPGQLLLHDTLDHLLDNTPGVRRIETYGPANDLQRSFATGNRTLYHLSVYRAGWVHRAHRISIRVRDSLAERHRRATMATAAAARVSDITLDALPQHPDAPFFATHEWFNLLATHGMRAGAPVHVLKAGTADGVCLPLLRHGGGFSALANFYSSLYAPPRPEKASGSEDAIALACWLRRERAAHLHLQPIAEDDAFMQALPAALRQQGFWLDRHFSSANWHMPCEGLSYADYVAQRPSRLRHTIQRTRKSLASMPGYSLQIVQGQGEALDEAVLAYGEVYANSWKKPEPFPDFIPALCRMAAARGWLRLGVVRLDGKPVAAQIWIVKNHTALIYKLAYHQAYAKLGVGTALQAALSEHVLEVDRVKLIDFLSGDEPYKSEWMSRRRERIGLIAFNPRTIRGLLGAARHFGGKALRRLLRRAANAADDLRERASH